MSKKITNKATVLRADGSSEVLGHRPTLEEAQKIVGGWVEFSHLRGTNKTLVMNEEGRLRNLPYNKLASEEHKKVYPYVAVSIVGDVILLEGWRTLATE